MLKRQQLENDEEEFLKSAKKQASSRTSVLSTSPVKSPAKQPVVQATTGAANTFSSYSKSPSKTHQFLPSFNSPQRSFVLTKTIEKSPIKSPVKSPQKEALLTTASPNRTPLNSPEKLATTPLQQSSINLLNFSPKPYKSPTQAKIAANLTRKIVDFSAASLITSASTVQTVNDILSPTKSLNDDSLNSPELNSEQSPTKSVADSPIKPVRSPIKSVASPIKSVASPLRPVSLPVRSPTKFESITPTTAGKPVSPVKTLNFNQPQSIAQPTTQSITSKSVSSFPAELTRKRSPVRLFASVKSSNPIKMISPITSTAGVATPERLCVSDKKKLFENAIQEETENARRVEEQKMFLLKKKFPGSFVGQEHSLPKKIKTSIMQFESRTNESPSWARSNNTNELKTQPKIVDVDMKKEYDENEDSIRPGDEISKFISQAEDTQMIDSKADASLNKSGGQFENSLHSIAEEQDEEAAEDRKVEDDKVEEEVEEKIEDQLIHQLDQSVEDLLSGDLLTNSNLVKSSTKANLYPSLSDLMESDHSTGASHQPKETAKTPVDLKGTPSLRHEEPVKQLTPMRTLSQYRREQKKKAMSGTPSHRLEEEQATREELAREERTKWDLYREQLRDKMIALKTSNEKCDRIIAQSSNAIATCLKNSEQRGSSYQLEAERILLITSQKRVACQAEIDRIKAILASTVQGKVPEPPMAYGCVRFKRIQLPLKGDFIVGQIADQDPLNHHFICVARCGELVIETEMLSSADSIKDASVTFEQNKLKFMELDMEFEIHLEIYGLALPKEKEKHHHEKRSLIKDAFMAPLSPKLSRSKKSAATGVLSYSADQGFIKLGQVTITKENLLDKKYDLAEFMYNAPFSGEAQLTFELSASYHTQLRDYLNFFDQTGPYPIWHRRWCVLKGYLLAYWRFSEDETVKPSLGSIDLRKCVNRKVGQVSYEICARSNTFMLALLKEVADQDLTAKQLKQKQAIDRNQVHKTVAVEKSLISTDLESDMKAWCSSLNRLLPLIRVWEEDASPVLDGPF